ncbi:MAG: amidase [Dehalococcoidia bacterium]
METELADLTIADAAALIAAQKVSPVELIEAVLERIERLDHTLRAYITVPADSARAAAREAERDIVAGGYRGPLHGIPMGIKDLYDMEGVGTTAGSSFLGGTPAVEDAPSVARLRAAGAIFTGKLNLHEFAFGADNLNPHHGYCRNPWNLDHIPGGSSGGSGAALAAGLCLGATGSDTGGSIRTPASFCGVVGHKPTRGLVSTRGLVPLGWTLDHAGPMAKTVRDSALMLNAMAGYDAGDPYSVERPAEDYSQGLGDGIEGLLVGIPRNHFFDNVAADVDAAVRQAARVMEGLGATVSDVQLDLSAAEGFVIQPPEGMHLPPLAGIAGVWLIICDVEAYTFHRPLLRDHADGYTPSLKELIELGAAIPGSEYVAAMKAREQLSLAFERTLSEEVDILLTPTTVITAPTIEANEKGQVSGPLIAQNPWVLNLTSQPSISVPCGFDAKGLPIGLMLSGRKWSDALVLRAAHAYEQATEWHTRRPPLQANSAKV